eukprot:scaffold864_cov246-Chaetoceros_neogracile.AAC.1
MQDSLSRIYESYSFQFPNPQVLRERENHARAQAKNNPNAFQGRKRAGIFAHFFGPDANHDISDKLKSEIESEDEGPSADESSEKDNVDINAVNECEQDEDDDIPLLGTDRFDKNVIPPEAYHCARFYLSSVKSNAVTASRHRTCRTFKVCQSDLKGQKSMWAIIDFGLLVEIPLDVQSGDISIDENAVVRTNDYDALLEAQQSYARSPTPLVPSMDLVRCTQVSTNCIAISWGMEDGIVVMYRKVQMKDGRVEWHSIAMVTPLEKTVMAAGKNSTMARIVGEAAINPRSTYESGLLRTTEVVALHLGSSQTGHKNFLAISRLGGYLEFIVLPNEVSQGPIIAPMKRRVRGQGHYAAGLPNISGDRDLRHGWLPTTEAHVDITAMTALRTHVSEDTVWDETLRPDAPPAEYIICTCGISREIVKDDEDSNKASKNIDGVETLALWRFTILQESNNENDVSVHIGLLDKLHLRNRGPTVSAFVSKSTASNWSAGYKPSSSTSSSTVTAESPICSIRIVSSSSTNTYLIATLNFNGGADIIDCSDIIRNATHEVGFAKNEMSVIQHSDEIRKTNARLCQDSASMVELCWWQSENNLHLVGVSSKGNMIVRKVVTSNDSNTAALRLPVVGLAQVPTSKASFITNSNTDVINLLGHTRKTNGEYTSSLWSIGNLSPDHYLKSLISQGRFQEASKTMNLHNLTIKDRSIMDEGFVRLWETNRNIEALKQVSNTQFVIQEALRFESLIENQPSIDLLGLHAILSEALQRIVSTDNSGITSDAQSKIQVYFSRLGTFILVGRLIGAKNISPSKFSQRFLKIDMTELAISFATHGDMRGMLLVIVRHWNELGSPRSLNNIIHHLPLSTPITEYEFLLPSNQYFDSMDKWEKLVEHVENHMELDLFVAENHKTLFYDSLSQYEISVNEDVSAMDWYLNRANEMISGFGFLDNAVLLINKALERCEDGVSADDDTKILDILSLRASVYHIHCIVELGVHLDTDLVDHMQSMSIEDFEGLGVIGAIRLILSGCRDSNETIFRYKELLCPMLCDDGEGTDFIIRCWPELISDEPSYNVDRRKELELGTVLFCLENLQKAVEQDQRECNQEQPRSLIALSLCEAVAKSSSSDVPIQDRIIDDVLFLMQFVLDTANIIGDILTYYHTEKLWNLYECLPTCPDQLEIDDEGWQILSQSLDCFYRSLTGLNLSLKWQRVNFGFVSLESFQHAHEEQMNNNDIELCSSGLAVFGTKLIHAMIQGFSTASASCRECHQDTLFNRFVSDVTDITEHCCYNLVSKSAVFNDYLIDSLLDVHSFKMLRKFLLCDLITKEALKAAAFNFTTQLATRYQECEYSQIIQIVSDFQACFSVASPDCCSGVETLDIFVTASNFMKESLGFSSTSIPSYYSFISASPMSMVDLALELNPRCVFLECPGWENPNFVSDAINNMSEQSSQLNDSESLGFPPIPGNHILHLANLVGLGDPRNQFLVKNRIVLNALLQKQHGVALILCITMLYDVIAGEKCGHRIDYVAQEILMKSIAAVISHRSLVNDTVRVHICKLCLSWFKSGECGDDSVTSFNCIMDTYSSLERRSIDMHFHVGSEICCALSMIRSIDKTFNVPNQFKDSGAVENSTANHILSWCSQTLFDASICKNYHVVQVLELAISSLTEGEVSREILSSLSTCLNNIETRSLADFPHGLINVDEAIVNKLMYRGYTRNGARRAAMATENESASTALLWAVTHASDEKFDDPIVLVRGENMMNNTVIYESAINAATSLLSRSIHCLGQKNSQEPARCSTIPKPIEIDNPIDQQSLEVGGYITHPQIMKAPSVTSIPNDEHGVSEVHSHRPKARMIVVPKNVLLDRTQPENVLLDRTQPDNNKLVEGGRQLLRRQRDNIKKSNRLKLAAEGRRILEQSRGRSSTNSCRSIESVDSAISSFTWNTFNSNTGKEVRYLDAVEDEESLNGINRAQSSVSKDNHIHIPHGANTPKSELNENEMEQEAAQIKTPNQNHVRIETTRECLYVRGEGDAKFSREKELIYTESEADRLKLEEGKCLCIEAVDAAMKIEEHLHLENEQECARIEAAEQEDRVQKEEDFIPSAAKIASPNANGQEPISARHQEEAHHCTKAEDEERLYAEHERLAQEEEEQLRVEAETTRLRAEEEERLRVEAETIRLNVEEKERLHVEKLAQEEEERLRVEAEDEERLQREVGRLAQELEERLRVEAEATRLKAEEEERLRLEAEELAQKEDERLRVEAEASRLRSEEEERLRNEAEILAQEEKERLRFEAEASKLKAEEEERLCLEAEKHAQEEEERLRVKAEATRLKVEEEKRLRLEAEELAQEEEERLRVEAEATRLKGEKEDRLRVRAEAIKLKAEDEEFQRIEADKLAQESEERLRGEAKAIRLKSEEEECQLLEAKELAQEEVERVRVEAVATRLKAVEEEWRVRDEAERLAQEEEEQLRVAADATRLEAEEEERLRLEADELAQELEERLRVEAEAIRLKAEREDLIRVKAENLAHEEEERLRVEAGASRLKAEGEERLRFEAERLAQEEEERLLVEAEASKLKAEREDLLRVEAENLAHELEERLRVEAEASKLKAEEEERRVRDEAERLAQEEEEQLRVEADAARLEAEEEERLRFEAERLAQEEEERLLVEAEASRLKAEREDLIRVEAENLAHELEERLRVEAEASKLKAEEEEHLRFEAERLAQEEEEQLRVAAEATRLEAEEEERLRLEAEELAQELEERLRVEAEASRLKAEREDLIRVEAKRLAHEEEERLLVEVEASKLKAEEEEHLRFEAERLAQEEEEQLRVAAEATRLEAEQEERLRLEAEELAQELEERLRVEAEASRLKAEREDLIRVEAERLAHEEEERLRVEAEASKLKAEEEERLRFEAERLAQEEEEQLRVAAEGTRLKAEERLRLEAEVRVEAEKLAQELEERLRVEAEASKLKAEEEERLRFEAEELAQEEEERVRVEAEGTRLEAEEEERLRLEAEDLAQELEERLRVESGALADVHNIHDSISLDDFVDDDGWGFDPECSAEAGSTTKMSQSSTTGKVFRSRSVILSPTKSAQPSSSIIPESPSAIQVGKVLRSGTTLHKDNMSAEQLDNSEELQPNGSGGNWSFEDVEVEHEEEAKTSFCESAVSTEDAGWDFDF